jgi:hypothetical protein
MDNLTRREWLLNEYMAKDLRAEELTGFPGLRVQISKLEWKWEVPCYLVMVCMISKVYSYYKLYEWQIWIILRKMMSSSKNSTVMVFIYIPVIAVKLTCIISDPSNMSRGNWQIPEN